MAATIITATIIHQSSHLFDYTNFHLFPIFHLIHHSSILIFCFLLFDYSFNLIFILLFIPLNNLVIWIKMKTKELRLELHLHLSSGPKENLFISFQFHQFLLSLTFHSSSFPFISDFILLKIWELKRT